MPTIFKNPHNVLKWLIALNIIGDLISIPFWLVLPTMANTQGSTLTVDATIAIADAAVAAALFAIALYEIIKKQKWGSILAIILTVTQRVVGFFMFQLNVGVAVEVIWSLLIIYFAYKEITRPKTTPKQ